MTGRMITDFSTAQWKSEDGWNNIFQGPRENSYNPGILRQINHLPISVLLSPISSGHVTSRIQTIFTHSLAARCSHVTKSGQ